MVPTGCIIDVFRVQCTAPYGRVVLALSLFSVLTMAQKLRLNRLRTIKSSLAAIVFLLTILGGFASAAGMFLLVLSDRPAAVLPQDQNVVPALLQGGFSSAIDTFTEENHPVRDGAVAFITALRLTFFREGTGPVVIGSDYRFYTMEEFEHHPSDARILAERVQWINTVAKAFRRDNVPLVIVLVPSKARVENRDLSSRWRSLANHDRYEYALQAIKNGPAHPVDPRNALAEMSEPFLRTDTHWTPAGAARVADLVRKKYENIQHAGQTTATVYALEESETVLHRGDLMQFVPLGRWERFFPLSREQVTIREVRQLDDQPQGGLFDSPDIPFTLVGTSFSAGNVWNFQDALRHGLQGDVLDFAEEGLGPFVPMQRYLTGETYREIPPMLVVWEIPERYLTIPGTDLPQLPESVTRS